MNQIKIWNPFKELETFQSQLSRFIGDDWSDVSTETKTAFTPKVDIYEDKESYRFKVELPEVKKEDIKVECDHGVMTISGHKVFENETKSDDKKYHRIERSYGSFTRSFTLPDAANAEMINAEYTNGVLDVKVAKKLLGTAAAKKITIK
ncbi:MAG: Hsp20/alpha crystallin family protein [Bdellovibrionota bacterium]